MLDNKIEEECIDEIEDAIAQLPDEELVQLHNELIQYFAEYNEEYDYGYIYENGRDIINNLLCDKTPYEILEIGYDYSSIKDWVMLDNSGDLATTSRLDDWIDYRDLAECLYNNRIPISNQTITQLMDDLQEKQMVVKAEHLRQKLVEEYTGYTYKCKLSDLHEGTLREVYDIVADRIIDDCSQTITKIAISTQNDIYGAEAINKSPDEITVTMTVTEIDFKVDLTD